jgi:hypothetical protein
MHPAVAKEMKRSFAEAVKRALKEGGAPEDYMKPLAEKLVKMALGGSDDSPVTLAAIKETLDRTEGRVKQQIEVERTDTTVDAQLLESMGDLLRLVQKAPKEKVVEGEVLTK